MHLLSFAEQEGYYGNVYQQYPPDFYPSQGPPPAGDSFITNGNSGALDMNPISHQGKYAKNY